MDAISKKLIGKDVGIDYLVHEGGGMQSLDGRLLDVNENSLVIRTLGVTGRPVRIALNLSVVTIIKVAYADEDDER